MIVTLDAKRRLTVPAVLAPASPGDYFDARFDAEEGAFVFRRLAGKKNWLTVLKACPVSPDDVPPRRSAPAHRQGIGNRSNTRGEATSPEHPKPRSEIRWGS
jgi:hypothetical protein